MFMRLMAPETERAESSLLISGEQVLMQSKLADTVNLKTSKKQSTRLLLDCGSQRTYISEDLVNNLQLMPSKTEILTVFTFVIIPNRKTTKVRIVYDASAKATITATTIQDLQSSTDSRY